MSALLNGAPVSGDLVHHRGLHYGDGVFRTCLIYEGQVSDISDQTQIVCADALHLGLKAAPTSLAREAARLARGQVRGVLKIMLLRAGLERGYHTQDSATDRLLLRYPAPEYPAACWQRGVSVFRSEFRLATQPALAGIKHLNRLEQVLASREWQKGADEGLLSDADGRPVCGTRTNLFWVKGSDLRTPKLERCGVAGHMRRKVIALSGNALAVDASWEEIEAADELLLTNSLIGIWPVARLGKRSWSAPGPVTRELMDKLNHPRLVKA